MELFATSPKWDDQLSANQNVQVFGNALARHAQVLTELIEGLAVVLMKLIEQGAATWMSESFEDVIHCRIYATKWLHIFSGISIPFAR